MTWISNTQPLPKPVVTAPAPPKPKPMDPYMTVIDSRRPKQKTHANIGHVKNAINAKMSYTSVGQTLDCDIQVYQLDRGNIELLHDFPKGTMWNEIPWVKEATEKRNAKEIAAKERDQRAFLRAVVALGTQAADLSGVFDEDKEGYMLGFVDAFKLAQAGGHARSEYTVRGLERELTKTLG